MNKLITSIFLLFCISISSCDTKNDPTPSNPANNTKPKLEELIKATVQYLDIEQDSTISIENYGTAHALVIKISFKKSDVGKGLPVIYKYVGKTPETAFTKKELYTSGYQFTMVNDQAFDIVIRKGDEKALLHNDSLSYRSFGIAQIYTNKIIIAKEKNLDVAIKTASKFMQIGKDLDATIIEVSSKGIDNQVVINSIIFKVK